MIVGPGIPPPNPASALNAPLVENPYAWTKKSAMLFVEQPGGTGFSTASSLWTGEEAQRRKYANQVVQVLSITKQKDESSHT